MRNICLVIAYDGTDFCGWQRQKQRPTVQGCLESALGTILPNKVNLIGSGRTDAGVHASHQVASFKTECRIPCPNLQEALNSRLPVSVRIMQVREASMTFHPRYDALAKTYRYRVFQAPVCPPVLGRYVLHYPAELNHKQMARAARYFEGEHDFTSFAAGAGQALEEDRLGSRVRRIFSSRILWRPQTSSLVYQIRGSGFLHHMVRNIVGTLIEVGLQKIPPDAILRILEGRDRALAGPTAPACGLSLVKVEY
jgi:tRNA pseudouridine38-40 synthase